MPESNGNRKGAYGKPSAAVAKFRLKARFSFAAIILFTVVGIVLIAVSVDAVPSAIAKYIAGVACLLAAVNMSTNWGASAGHGDLAEYCTEDHQRLFDLLDGRVEDVEDFERKQVELLGGLVDQVGAYRERHRNHS